jgi:nitrate reductase NapE
MESPTPPHTRAEELRAFLFLSVIVAPVIAMIVVGGYGLLVWIFQMFSGPPGS